VTFESGRLAGEVRSAGGAGYTAGNVTFVNVHEAGLVFLPLSSIYSAYSLFCTSHMVPFDQPDAALVCVVLEMERICMHSDTDISLFRIYLLDGSWIYHSLSRSQTEVTFICSDSAPKSGR